MTISIPVNDPRPVFTQNPRASADDDLSKQEAIPGRASRPIPVTKAGAGEPPRPLVTK